MSSFLKWLAGVASVLFALVALVALFIYLRPLLAIQQLVRLDLWRHGAKSRYTRVCTRQGCFQLHYYVAGEGAPVVLIHGIGNSGESWALALKQLNEAGFRVYALDLPGSGRSDRPDADYSIAFQAETVNAFIQGQALAKPDVAGVSMGGWIAMDLAIRHPDAVRRLVLLDTAGTTFAPAFQPSLFEPKTGSQLQRLFNFLTPYPTKLPAFFARDILRTMAPDSWIIHRAMTSMFSKRDLVDKKLSAIAAPTLILWGKQDRLIPVETGELLQRSLLHSRLVTYEGCGHLLLEACGKQVVPEIERFLKSQS